MSELTRPVEPECYGSDQTFGWFWRHNFDKLMSQARPIERERDEYKDASVKLYVALVKMVKRRGIDMDDADIVLGAMEHYEKMINGNRE